MAAQTELVGLRARFAFGGGRGDSFANGKGVNWPLCENCQAVMEKADLEVRVASFFCPQDGFTVSFPSCRYSDRYCAWERARAGGIPTAEAKE